ncbi:CYFA0S01e05072g1_1 [Cyberlindnera fabianii]|uniref:RNA polymerase II holoenzyme cyclin-like subunit n=1 Tax=Cyberlindnera fabianii TaxID=36022 RepID=A0A061AH14_CYBFA|nr:CYFA0S01e05072g1_1 [Cyberlindnera fabianii]
MSADYWTSTQRKHWQFTRDSLRETRKELKLLENTMEETGLVSRVEVTYDMHMRIYIHSLVNKLGRRLNVRQFALSTAEVYLLRFLTRVSLKEVNLYLLITTAVYLACKIEECPQHIRTVVSEARNLWPEYIPHDATKVAEFEFYLIEELETYLVVHHPYRSLLLINETLAEFNQKPQQIHTTTTTTTSTTTTTTSNGMTPAGPLTLSPEELQSSWSIINDSYVCDLPLLFPPHIIATAAVYLTIVLKYNHLQYLHKEGTPTPPKTDPLNTFVQFLGFSNIDIDQVVEAVQELITLYEAWESYHETSCKKPLESVLLNR